MIDETLSPRALEIGRHASGLASTALIGTVVVASRHPGTGFPCVFRATTGIPCPGCGMSRSLEALLQGNPGLSFRYHPLGIGLALLAIVASLLWLAGGWAPAREAHARLLQRASTMRSMQSVLALLLSTWAVRGALSALGCHFFMW